METALAHESPVYHHHSLHEQSGYLQEATLLLLLVSLALIVRLGIRKRPSSSQREPRP